VDGLGPAGLDCLEADRLSPPGGRYEIRWAVPLGASPRAFTACVIQVTPSGQRSARALDERRAAYQVESTTAPPDQASAAAHGSDALRALRYCLWRFAAEHSSYPTDIAGIDDCVGPSLEQAGDTTRFTYAPAPPDSAGHVVDFVVIEGLTEWSPGLRSRRLDAIGTIRVTQEPRIPSLYDPLETDPAVMREPPDRVQDAPSYAGLPGPAAAVLAMRACFGDTGAACAAAARLAAETQHATEARQGLILQRGCNLGDATSCLTLARLSIERRLPAVPPGLGEQLHAIACSTAPLPDGCP